MAVGEHGEGRERGHRFPAVELLVRELADARLVGDAQHPGHGEDDFGVAVRGRAVHVGGPHGVAQQPVQQVRGFAVGGAEHGRVEDEQRLVHVGVGSQAAAVAEVLERGTAAERVHGQVVLLPVAAAVQHIGREAKGLAQTQLAGKVQNQLICLAQVVEREMGAGQALQSSFVHLRRNLGQATQAQVAAQPHESGQQLRQGRQGTGVFAGQRAKGRVKLRQPSHAGEHLAQGHDPVARKQVGRQARLLGRQPGRGQAVTSGRDAVRVRVVGSA